MRPTITIVYSAVLSVRQNLKILRAVVRLHSIAMVDNLILRESSAKSSLGNKIMLIGVAVGLL